MELKERVRHFLKDTGATVTSFCKKVQISPPYYYQWMKNEVEFSESIIHRIKSFLDDVYAK